MRLVLCDDHTLLTESLAAALTGKGFSVAAITSSPAQGLAAVRSLEPDVLLLDVHFPADRTANAGLALARLVQERHPRTKVLMLSADDDPAIVAAALEIGVAGFTRKDQRVDGIVHILHRIAQGEVAVDPMLLRAAVRHLKSPAADPAERALRHLTPREREVLRRIVNGESTKQIARAMKIAQSTTRTHVQNVLTKLGVHSRGEASAIVARLGPIGRLGAAR